MQELYFLFILTGFWILFATIQDFRTREISNWLNFSLIAFVLSYRAFYSILNNDWRFFVFGILGVLIFVILGYGFYYSRVMAGGDVKLLMGIGGIFPFVDFVSYLTNMGIFVLLLFGVGSIYSMIYSAYLIYYRRKGKELGKTFNKELANNIINGYIMEGKLRL